MSREVHVRICEGVGVRFPRATRLVMVCALERDAQRLLTVLPQRLGKYGLTLHPTKTQVTRFTRPPSHAHSRRHTQSTPAGTFDLLGFTHYWGRSRQGNWVVKRQTATARLSRALTRINAWCRDHRHAPVSWQHQQLVRKLRGHYAYYGITGNLDALRLFRLQVIRRWRKWLGRRSHRARWRWERFARFLIRYPLPQAIMRHATPVT